MLEKISINGYGKLNNIELKFQSGCNMVFGPNEAGKSTIQAFIKALFYGQRKGKIGGITEKERFSPWSGGLYGGILEYSIKNSKRFRVWRDFETNKIKIFDSQLNEITNQFNSNRNGGVLFAEEQLGIDQELFIKTSFISQSQVRLDAQSEAMLADRIASIIESGSERTSYADAKKLLEKTLLEEVGSDRTTGKPLDKIKQKIERLEKEKKYSEDVYKKILELEVVLRDCKKTGQRIEMEVEYARILREIKQFEKSIDQIERGQDGLINNWIKQHARIKSEIAQIESVWNVQEFHESYFNDIIMIRARYEETTRSIKELEIQISQKEFEIKRINTQIPNGADIFEDDISNRIMMLKNNIIKFNNSDNKEANKKSTSDNGILGIVKSNIWLALVLISLITLVYDSALWSISLFLGMSGLTILLLAQGGNFGTDNRNNFKNKQDHLKLTEIQNELEDILVAAGVSNTDEYFERKKQVIKIIEQRNLNYNASRVINQQIEILNKRLKAICDRFEDLVRGLGLEIAKDQKIYIEDIELNNKIIGFAQKINEKKRLKSELEILESRIDETRGASESVNNNQVEKIQEQFNIAMQRAEEIFSHLWNLDNSDLYSPNEFLKNDYEHVVKFFECCMNNLREIQLKTKEVETEIKVRVKDVENLPCIEEELSLVRIQKRELEEYAGSIRMALEVMKECGNQIKDDIGPKLINEVSKISRAITKSSGDIGVSVDGSVIKLSIQNGDIIPISYLSAGTIDQIYFALRISVADIISSNQEPLPLIMDELFSMYDDQRLKSVAEYLRDICKHKQVILFTCRKDEVQMMRSIITDLNLIELNMYRD